MFVFQLRVFRLHAHSGYVETVDDQAVITHHMFISHSAEHGYSVWDTEEHYSWLINLQWTLESDDWGSLRGFRVSRAGETQWSDFFGGKNVYSTARATANAMNPVLNPRSRTSLNVTGGRKEYLHASFLKKKKKKNTQRTQYHRFYFRWNEKCRDDPVSKERDFHEWTINSDNLLIRFLIQSHLRRTPISFTWGG